MTEPLIVRLAVLCFLAAFGTGCSAALDELPWERNNRMLLTIACGSFTLLGGILISIAFLTGAVK